MQNSAVDLKDRVAIVTGGSSGIGRACAELLAKHGARVVVGDSHLRSQENAGRFAELGIVEQTCDVRKEADIQRLVEAATGKHGRLDIVVCCAGIGMVKQITEVSEADWDACIDVNLKGAFLAAKHAIPWLRKAGGGSIVNMASNAGLLPRAHDPVYSTSKGALIALTKSLALCHTPDKIRVNAVCPGPVAPTAMMDADLAAAKEPELARQKVIAASPLAKAHGRMITPEEVAEAVLYLCSDAAVMVTGTSIAIDGGKSLGVPPS